MRKGKNAALTDAATYLIFFIQDGKVTDIHADGVVQDKKVLELTMLAYSSSFKWSIAPPISHIAVRAALYEQL